MVVNTLREWKLQCPKGSENLVFPTRVGTVEYLANVVQRYVQPPQVAAAVVDGKGRAKYGMHALRIAHQGRELLATGRITLPIQEPERSRLMEVRRGEIPLEAVLDRLHRQSAALEHEILEARIPDEPDRDRVDQFLVSAYRRAWANDAAAR